MRWRSSSSRPRPLLWAAFLLLPFGAPAAARSNHDPHDPRDPDVVATTDTVHVSSSAIEPPADVHGSFHALEGRDVRSMPGAIGDVFRALHALPGVGVASSFRNDLMVRGGSPNENLVLVNGFQLDVPNHVAAQGTTGGALSMLDPATIERVTLTTGSFPATDGDRLSSFIGVQLREGDRGRFQLASEVNAAGISGRAGGPLGGRGSWQAAARQGYYDLLSRVLAMDVVPFTTDGQLSLVHEPTPSDRVELLAIAGQDRVHVPVDASRPADTFTWDIRDRGWQALAGAAWRHRFGEQGAVKLALSQSAAEYDQDIHDAFVDLALVLRNRSREDASRMRADATLRTRVLGELAAGVAAERWSTHHGLSQPMGTEDPFSTDPARIDTVDIDRRDAGWNETAYLQTTASLAPWFTGTLGARAGWFGALAAGFLDPRLGLTLRPVTPFAITLSAGTTHQQPPLVYVHAAPQNASLAPMRAGQVATAVEWTPAAGAYVKVDAYEKRYRDIPASTNFPSWTLASQGELTGAYEQLLPLASIGTGRARGVEVALARERASGLHGRASFTFARTWYSGADGVEHPGAFDVPRAGDVLAGWRQRPGWDFSARFRAATGRPFTPTLEPLSTQQGRYVYDLSRVNAERTPAFRQLDLRIEDAFTLDGHRVTAYAEVQNVLDRDNVFRYVWDTLDRRLEPLPELGVLPLVGVEVVFR